MSRAQHLGAALGWASSLDCHQIQRLSRGAVVDPGTILRFIRGPLRLGKDAVRYHLMAAADCHLSPETEACVKIQIVFRADLMLSGIWARCRAWSVESGCGKVLTS